MLSLLELRQDPDIQSVLMGCPDSAYAQELALAKRFCECFRGDDEFRQGLEDCPESTLQQADIPWQLDQLKPLYQPVDLSTTTDRLVRRVWAFHQEKLERRNQLRQQMKLQSPGFDAWRRRQLLRCAWQLAEGNADAIVHPPAAFELSRGCSVGCWFCGVSAPKLSDLWPASPENLRLWREILEVVLEFCGPAAGHSFLYWATDPLDNPDYEKFALAFHEVTGQFPQTTTALALKDVERTRALLALSEQCGCPLNRFSVLTLGQLRQIHAQFSPRELLRVELVLQNKQSLGALSAAGKALTRLNPETSHANTIACVSGFLFNLPDRSLRLVTPCPSSQRWPDGYRTEAQATFSDALQLRTLLQQWSLPRLRLSLEDVPRFREDLNYEPRPGGFRLQDGRKGVDFHSRGYAAMESLGALLSLGKLSLEQLSLQLDVPVEETLLAIQELFRGAYLEEPV